MAIFAINQVFEAPYPPEAAAWCNENNAYLEEFRTQNGVRCFRIVTPPEPTEAERLQIRLKHAKAERAAAVEALTVEVDGMVFDGDEKSQERMSRAVSMADSMDETTEWVLHDNTVAVVTASQLRQACRKAGKAQTAIWILPYQK